MGKFVIKRLGISIVVILLISIFSFSLVHMLPGDPAGVDVAALRAALMETLDHPELAQARAEAARRNLCEHFTWDAVFAKIMEIIKENGR